MATKPTLSWRDVLPIHPAAADFPRLTLEELQALGEDIKKNGQRQPIAIIERARRRPDGTFHISDPPLQEVLDGISRLDAMEAAGITVTDKDGQLHEQVLRTVVDTDEVDPVPYVISANIHRRHLTAEQKRELIAELLKAAPEKSDRQIAKAVKASPTFVGKVRAEKEATGDVSTVDTRRDSRGRQQRAHKPRNRHEREDVEENGSPPPEEASAGKIVPKAEVLLRFLERSDPAVQRDFVRHLPAEMLAYRDDIGAASRVPKLENHVRRLDQENSALRMELEELRGKLAAASSEIATTTTVTAGDSGPLHEIVDRKPEATGASNPGNGVTLKDAVASAFNVLGELASECREAVENAPQETQRIQTLDDTASILENLDTPDISDELAEIAVSLPKHHKPRSRSDRRDTACDTLGACMDALDTINANDPRQQQARILFNTLEDTSSEALGCEFPGWRG
jgi:hypothetical protein